MEWLLWVLIGFTLPIAAAVLGMLEVRGSSCEVWKKYTHVSKLFGWITPALAILAVLPLTYSGLSPISLVLFCVAPMLTFRTIDYVFALVHYRRRIKDRRWTQKLVWSVVSGWIGAMITPALIALYLIVSAAFSDGHFVIRPSVKLFVVFLFASWIVNCVFGLRRYYIPGEAKSLAPCELRTRASQIAAAVGARLYEVRILVGTPYTWAGGYAYGPYVFALTEDLIRKLKKPEVDSIIAHELGHVAHRYYWWLYVPLVLLSWLGLLWGALLVEQMIMTLSAPFNTLQYVLWISLFLIPKLASTWYDRYRERAANQYVYAFADPRASISANYKLTLINDIPFDAPRWVRMLSTHPTIREEIETIACYHGISEDEVQQILSQAEIDLSQDLGEHYEPVFSKSKLSGRDLMQRPKSRELQASFWIALVLSTVAIVGFVAAIDILHQGNSLTASIVFASVVVPAVLVGVGTVALAYRRCKRKYNNLGSRMREKLESLYPSADRSMILVDVILMGDWDNQIWQGALLGVRDDKLVVLGELREVRIDIKSVRWVARYNMGRANDDLLSDLHAVIVWYEIDGVPQWIALANLGQFEKGLSNSTKQLEAYVRAALVEAGVELGIAREISVGHIKRGAVAILVLTGICGLLHLVLHRFGMRDSWMLFAFVGFTVGRWLWAWVVYGSAQGRPLIDFPKEKSRSTTRCQ